MGSTRVPAPKMVRVEEFRKVGTTLSMVFKACKEHYPHHISLRHRKLWNQITSIDMNSHFPISK